MLNCDRYIIYLKIYKLNLKKFDFIKIKLIRIFNYLWIVLIKNWLNVKLLEREAESEASTDWLSGWLHRS